MDQLSKIDERRQRSLEAFYDAMKPGDVIEARAVADAIETATRVKITDEALALSVGASRNRRFGQIGEVIRDDLAAALTELGFEVEE